MSLRQKNCADKGFFKCCARRSVSLVYLPHRMALFLVCQRAGTKTRLQFRDEFGVVSSNSFRFYGNAYISTRDLYKVLEWNKMEKVAFLRHKWEFLLFCLSLDVMYTTRRDGNYVKLRIFVSNIWAGEFISI